MEIGELTYSGIGSMDLMDMEAALKESPWFSYLREILMEKLYRKDKEAFAQTLAQTAVLLTPSSRPYRATIG